MMNMTEVGEIKRLAYAWAISARDLLLPGLMSAGSGHDCDLVVSEDGDICAICHDKWIMLPIAYAAEFDREKRLFHEEDLPFVERRLDAFKKAINREEPLDAAFGKFEVKPARPSIMDITRMFG